MAETFAQVDLPILLSVPIVKKMYWIMENVFLQRECNNNLQTKNGTKAISMKIEEKTCDAAEKSEIWGRNSIMFFSCSWYINREIEHVNKIFFFGEKTWIQV